MSKKFLDSLLTDRDFFLEDEFYKNNTNFNSGLEFHNALGVYTIGDKVKMARNPNLDDFISQNSKFNNFSEFCDALEEYLKKDLPDFFKDVL